MTRPLDYCISDRNFFHRHAVLSNIQSFADGRHQANECPVLLDSRVRTSICHFASRCHSLFPSRALSRRHVTAHRIFYSMAAPIQTPPDSDITVCPETPLLWRNTMPLMQLKLLLRNVYEGCRREQTALSWTWQKTILIHTCGPVSGLEQSPWPRWPHSGYNARILFPHWCTLWRSLVPQAIQIFDILLCRMCRLVYAFSTPLMRQSPSSL